MKIKSTPSTITATISYTAMTTAVMLAICGIVSTAGAEIIEYTGTATITESAFPSDIAVGDIFHVTVTYDDSTIDTNNSTYAGRFDLAVQTFVITRDPGNTGTWDPATGIWEINPCHNHYTNDNGDSMGVQNHGTGFAPLGGIPFFDGNPSWDWDPSVHDLVDNGLGQTLRNIFGDVSPDFANTEGAWLEFRNTDYDAAIGTMVLECIKDGDVNSDGEITAGDAQFSFEITLGTYTPTVAEECAADCNGDGEVTAGDAQTIFNAVLGTGSCVVSG